MEKIKILGICASPIKKGNCEAFLNEACKAAESMGEVETEIITLRNVKMKSGCIHCHWCEEKQQPDLPPCVIKDDLVEIWPKIIAADGFLWATPVYGANASWLLNTFIDRWRCLAHSNYFQGALDNKVVGNLAVLWFRESGAESCLLSMMWRVLTMGMIPACGFNSRKFGAIGYSTPQGSGVLPEVKEGEKVDKLLVLQDKHGLQSARIIGKRTVFLARALKKARSDENERIRSKMAVSGKNKLSKEQADIVKVWANKKEEL
jgi:multimeric flavodoxin WrbA